MMVKVLLPLLFHVNLLSHIIKMLLSCIIKIIIIKI